MNPRILTIFISLALLGFSISVLAGKPDKCPTWPSCDTDPEPEPGPVPEYTVALTMGGFRFGPVNITPNNRKTGYTTGSTLDLSRPCTNAAPAGQAWEGCGDAGGDDDVWDAVFLACSEVLSGAQIEGFTVGPDWGITQGGKKNSDARNIRITFRTVVADEFPDADLWLALISWDSFPRSMFFPDEGEKSVYHLDTVKVYGGDVGNHLSCNTGEFLLLKTTQLEICHKTYNGPGVPSSACD